MKDDLIKGKVVDLAFENFLGNRPLLVDTRYETIQTSALTLQVKVWSNGMPRYFEVKVSEKIS
jgi:hypothetical protein